jgi:hypothetical protein
MQIHHWKAVTFHVFYVTSGHGAARGGKITSVKEITTFTVIKII